MVPRHRREQPLEGEPRGLLFSELDTDIVGTVKFGNNSGVDIRCYGTVVFQCKAGEHKALTDVYYIPRLRNNIVSIDQMDERDCRC